MSIASSGAQSTDSLSGKLTFEQDKNRIVGRDADNLARLLILADGTDFVMKVAKDGFDVLSATGDQLIFNSEQNVFKIVSSGTVSLPAGSLNTGGANYGFNAAASSITPHNLGYAPSILAFVTSGGSYVPMPWELQNGTTASSFCRLQWRVAVDETNIYGITELWGYNVNTTSPATTAKYYLLQETAN